MAIQAVKATLSTGKVVYLRKMRIEDSELAAQEVAQKAGDSTQLLQIFMQKALVKNLLLQVDDKKLSPMEKEDLNSLFEVGEYAQVMQVVGKMAGGDEVGKSSPVIALVNFGDKLPGSVDTPA